jgi:hypothetical protein
MIAVSLNIRDEISEKIMYLIKSLPKQDIQIVSYEKIEEINPTTLAKDHFDYMTQEEVDELDRMSQMVKCGNLSEFQDFEDLKNEIQNSSL